jgi:LmbE family N-acetylglucosaminyl deacetylase
MKNIMVFAAHPDDDLIGCGGSIVKHVSNKNNVTVVYMTSGDAGSLKYGKKELAKIREEEARNAANVTGAKNLVFLRNPDGYLEYNKENLIILINLIRKDKPDIVYVHHSSDWHKDHRVANELVIESINRAAGPWFQECKGKPWYVGTILGYEVYSAMSMPEYVEDITQYNDKKINALRQHKSQIENLPYDEWVNGLARFRGAMTGKGKYCEVFEVIRVDKIL